MIIGLPLSPFTYIQAGNPDKISKLKVRTSFCKKLYTLCTSSGKKFTKYVVDDPETELINSALINKYCFVIESNSTPFFKMSADAVGVFHVRKVRGAS